VAVPAICTGVWIMPKTVSIAPSWYWPEGTPRFCGIPPFGVQKMIVDRLCRSKSLDAPAIGGNNTSITVGQLAAAVRELRHQRAAHQGETGAWQPIELCTGEPAATAALAVAALTLDRVVSLQVGEGEPGGGEPWLALEGARVDAGRLFAGHPQASPTESSEGNREQSTQMEPQTPAATGPGDLPVVGLAENPAWAWRANVAGEPVHSQGSLVAQAISLSLFFRPLLDRPWSVALPPSNWLWPGAILTALYAGTVLTVMHPTQLAALARESVPSVLVCTMADIGALARESKRELKGLRGSVSAVIASIEGVFDPGDRKRAEKLLGCPVLTVLGTKQVGPVVASHPSWYVAESVGIPVTNVDIVPVDPQSKQPIQTLWELVEFADMTVRSPMGAPFRYAADGRSLERTSKIVDLEILASSDPNGMIYVIPA
jgi:hypothetical protein